MTDKRFDSRPPQKSKVRGHTRKTKKGETWVREHVRELRTDLREKTDASISDIEFEDGKAYFEINVNDDDMRGSRSAVDRTLEKHFGNNWEYEEEHSNDTAKYSVEVEMEDVEY